ncbi:MAG: hypothetical protein FWD13_07195 [Treponema sp.]|nr:hypothetical protein [Treponema sp.]
MGKFDQIIHNIQEWFQKLSSGQKRRLALSCTIAFAVFLTISVIISMSNYNRKKNTGNPERITIFSPIPAEELFLPDEPDFIHGVILEREQRLNWNEQDAAEYWQDPLRFGEEPWREKIEATVDLIFERVP